MSKKNNFLLVDLNEAKTQKLAETITSPTSRKILNHLTEKEDSEANIAKSLDIPISTVHYHLQKLQQAKLVVAEEFHYSKKGREVNHYKLANKYIIIAPKKVSGLKEKLKGILPVAVAALGLSAIIKVVSNNSLITQKTMGLAEESMAAAPEAAGMMADAGPEAARLVADTAPTIMQQPDIAFWFLAGSVATMIIYLIIAIIKERLNS